MTDSIPYRKKMIEVAMPLEAINRECEREKQPFTRNHPRSIHIWWARRPLASCRAVLFGQLVDDPSSWPERFPTEEEQDTERKRLFGILEDLVLWQNSNNTRVLNAARKEIARSLARNRVDNDEGTDRDEEVLTEKVSSEVVNAYLAEIAPPVHDPFAGGGSIPLEAQRLGLRAIATDLNPVAVLINKALIEIPPKFAGREPVNPKAEKRTNWSNAEGLAEDVRRYGEWMRDEAKKRIGHLYPEVDLPEEHGGGKATVIAWLWARTVESPNPAFKGVQVPLVRSFMLSTKKGKRAWVEPVFSEDRKLYRFEIRTGDGKPEIEGTVARQGAFCLASGDPMPFPYIRSEAKAGRMGARLLAIVADGNRKRIYIQPTDEMQAIAGSADPQGVPDTDLPEKALGFRVQEYGMTKYRDLFTPRQLVALTTFTDLVLKARDKAMADALTAGWNDDGRGLENGGNSVTAYAEACGVYLALGLSRWADMCNSIASWNTTNQNIRALFSRQAIPMAWDFAELSPFSSVGPINSTHNSIANALGQLVCGPSGVAEQCDAAASKPKGRIICCDPPYYDNIGYADLSDFFYVWLRPTVREFLPSVTATVSTPKADELIATPYRHGSSAEAEEFFLSGMKRAMSEMAGSSHSGFPVAIYYAFKQSETRQDGTSSTGWETFLGAVLAAGFSITSTLPARTERAERSVGLGTNALASSMILVCRPQSGDAPQITRGDFRRLLLDELPAATHDLQKANIAPVDMSQASIGPGLAVFSRHSRVIEADGSAMSVRTALQIINEVVDEIRGGEEMDLDAETRFAITWFETNGFAAGAYGDSETLAISRNVSVDAVARAGLLHSAAGSTRLLTRAELPEDWDPTSDSTLTVWECVQHLIKRLEENGEQAASKLLSKMGPRAEAARNLAYRLYTHCERKGNAEEARAYNGLVVAWPELEKLASQTTLNAQPAASQARLFEGNN